MQDSLSGGAGEKTFSEPKSKSRKSPPFAETASFAKFLPNEIEHADFPFASAIENAFSRVSARSVIFPKFSNFPRGGFAELSAIGKRTPPMSAVVETKNSFGKMKDIETVSAFSKSVSRRIVALSSRFSSSVPPFSSLNFAEFSSADSREIILHFFPSAEKSSSVNARCKSVKNRRAMCFVSEKPTAAPIAEKSLPQTKSSVRLSL